MCYGQDHLSALLGGLIGLHDNCAMGGENDCDFWHEGFSPIVFSTPEIDRQIKSFI